MTKGNKGKSKAISSAKHKEQLERKRDARARRNALKKEREAKEYLENDENFVSFSNQLQAVGYKIKDMKADGNCLFRALADQLDGSDDGHLRYRRIIVKYLADHREEFEPFVEDNRSFDEHVRELSKPGTYGGNDSIVAFSRCHGVNVVIHQLNERCWVINGDEYRKSGDPLRELHISYHNGDHYSSLRRIGDPDDGPAWLFNNQHKVKNETAQFENKAKPSKQQKAKKTACAVYDEAIASDESSDVAIIQAATGCQDLELIQQTFLESNNDLDGTISYILQLQSLSTMEENVNLEASPEDDVDNPTTSVVQNEDQKVPDLNQEGTKPSYDNTLSKPNQAADQNVSEKMAHGGAIPKTKQQIPSSAKRKHLAKQEKKARRMEERREEIKSKHKESGEDLEKQNVQRNDSTTLSDFLDLEALAI